MKVKVQKTLCMENILNQGLELAVFGMVTVFSFLTLLILATRVLSLFVRRFHGGEEGIQASTSGLVGESVLVAIVSAAVRQHVKKK